MGKAPQVDLFDSSLTPRTASAKGYWYIDDVIYNAANPSWAILDLLEARDALHFKFGKPGGTTVYAEYFGLYIPRE